MIVRKRRQWLLLSIAAVGMAAWVVFGVPSVLADQGGVLAQDDGTKSAAHDRTVTKMLRLRAVPCHGANVFENRQVARWNELRASWDDSVPEEVKDFWQIRYAFREVGVLGEDGPIPIDENTPPNSTVVSFPSPELVSFLATLGMEVEHEPPAANRPIHDPMAWTTLGLERSTLPAADPSLPKWIPVRNTIRRVTLRKWNNARGTAILQCFDDGTGRFVFRGRNALSNIPYTFWAIHAATRPETVAATGSPIMVWPVGGLPTAATATAAGRLEFSRDLHYCPLELDDPFMYLAIFAHWDGAVAGNQFGTNVFDKYGAGNAAGVQMCVSVGEHLLDLE